jgi:predicted permease
MRVPGQNLRYAIRTLGRNPGFAFLAVLTLGLGIGANVAIFSAVDAVLFRPLGVTDPDSVVRIYATDEEGVDLSNTSYPVFTDYRDGATAFAGMAAFNDADPFHVSTGGKPERVTGALVSGTYFELLGAHAAHGRLLTAADDRVPGAHPVAVVSDRFWRTRLGGDPAAVGSTLQVNGHPFTVVGVAAPGYTGVNLDSLPDVWVPIAMVDRALPEFADEKVLSSRSLSWLEVVARLKPGVSLARAQSELDTIAKRRAAGQKGDMQDPMARVLPASDFAVGPAARNEARRLSWLLFGMAGLVLLIASADAAGLLLLRAERRRREIGVRLALGASRGQIARQRLVESALLAGLGAGAGVLFAVWAAELLGAAVPPEFALPMGAATAVLDTRALAFAAAAAGVCALVAGFAPAFSSGRLDVLASIKGTAVPAEATGFGLRDGLVAGQIALTALLLVGAGLTARTLAKEAAVNPGFAADGRIEASLDLSRQGYDRKRGRAFLEELLVRARSLPGVRTAAFARTTPVQSAGMRTTIETDGYTPAPGENPAADLNIVSPGFFDALGARLIAGRDFDARDTEEGAAVAIVSEEMARRYWPGVSNPVGRRIMNLGPPGVGGEVVGIVSDVRYRSLRRAPDPTVYVPMSQFYTPRMTVLLEAPNADGLRKPLAEAVSALDAGLPLFHVRTLEEKLGLSLGQGRLLAWLVGTFAGLALLLSATGLYGVVSYATQARTREFSIRIALGAPAGSLRRLVLSRGARLALLGIAAGLAAAAAASRLADRLLYGVSPLDPWSFLAAAGILGAAVLAASALPAERAARVDPMAALKSE